MAQGNRRARRHRIAGLVLSTSLGITGLAAAPALAAPASASPSLRATALVPGSSDPVAVAAAAALQALFDQQAGLDAGQAAGTRAALAQLVAPRAKLAAADLDAVWAGTAPARLVALYAALGQVGVPYRRNASAPGVGFDCSGLTTYAWSVAGERLARSSGSQIAALAGSSLEVVQPGDVLWYPGHVGLALGIGKAYVHSPFPGRPVEISAPRRVARVGAPDLR